MKILYRIIIVIVVIHIGLCGFFYLFQERFIFHPTKLDQNYEFHFDQEFEEINIKTENNKSLNGILFKSDSTKGVIFYLHGNAGALNSWGQLAPLYTNMGYDILPRL